MKKKLITIVIGAMLCAGLFAGCGQSNTKQDKAAGTESAKQADTKDERRCHGRTLHNASHS